MMTKEALAASKLLKALGIGAGAAAIGAGSGMVGYRTGAKRTANAMASAFSEANARENRAMIDAFNQANKRENAVLANAYLRRGYQMGLQHATTSSGMKKSASDIHDQGFIDELSKLGFDLEELEKIGFNVAALRSLGTAAIGAVGKSFKSLPGLGKSVVRTGKTAIGAGRNIVGGKSVSQTVAKKLQQNLRGLGTQFKRSGAALGTMGAAGGAGYLATRD